MTTVSNTLYPLDNITGLSTATGLYACNRLLSAYQGPTIQLTNTIKSVVQDFFADAMGNLNTSLSGNGISVFTWMSNNAIFFPLISKWYDQSDKGNHIVAYTANPPAFSPVPNSTPIMAAVYDPYNKLVDFLGTYPLNIPSGAFPSGDSSYTISIKHGYANNLDSKRSPIFMAADRFPGIGVNQQGGYSRTDNNGGVGQSTITDFQYGNVVTYGYATGAKINSRKLYVSGILVDLNEPIPKLTAFTNGSSVTTYGMLGSGWSGNSNTILQGQIHFLSIFRSVLSSSDQSIVESQYATVHENGLNRLLYIHLPQ